MQQINFTGDLNQAEGAKMFSIIEAAKDQISKLFTKNRGGIVNVVVRRS